MTSRLRSLVLSVLKPLVGLYLRLSPSERGKYRLMRSVAALSSGRTIPVETADGRRFELEFPRDLGWENLLFTDDFEGGTHDALARVLLKDDVVVDAGANIGWFTTFFARICPAGHCHAFEPQRDVFGALEHNCAINGLSQARVTLNRLGLGDLNESQSIFTFDGLPSTYASLSSGAGAAAVSETIDLVTLESYAQKHGLSRIDCIKLDVEGAEMAVLRGAVSFLSSEEPPIVLVEINDRTSRAFGYEAKELLEFLSRHHDYRFFRIPGGVGELEVLRSLEACQHADNVLCLPRHRELDSK